MSHHLEDVVARRREKCENDDYTTGFKTYRIAKIDYNLSGVSCLQLSNESR
jgi:hypothetical protein